MNGDKGAAAGLIILGILIVSSFLIGLAAWLLGSAVGAMFQALLR